MIRRSAVVVIALVLTLGGVLALWPSTAVANPANPTARALDRDCSDFANQRDAQLYFLDNGGPNSDPDRLDADGDGIACESNPCPCYNSTTPPSNGGGGGGTAPQPQPEPSKPPRRVNLAKVIKVVDGDTVDVRIVGGKKARVRLIGIDTPEVFGGTECGGPKASNTAKKLLPRGAAVTLTSDRTHDNKDRYGRLLRYVKKGKSDINRVQVSRGNAKVYIYAGKPFERVAKYRKAQTQAKRDDRGIWGACGTSAARRRSTHPWVIRGADRAR